MRSRSTGYLYVAALLVVAAVAVQPASATLPTPNQPILLVQDNTSSNLYQNFVSELLTTEGLNGFQVAQLGDLTSTSGSFLASYDVVILPHLTLTTTQATLFQNYVNAGGTLVGFRPDLQLASVFGVAPLGTTLQEGWLKIDTTTAYGFGLVSNVMKFHGTADLYSLSGASVLAALYQTAVVPTTSPAAAINTFGLGKAILFSFDLSQSIVLMRQGNPAWAGYPDNHDGYNTMRAAGMFMDLVSGQFWNDLGDGALNDVPQADIQMRLFSNIVTLTNAAKRPLPRFWYFPNLNRSLLLMTGDHHGDPVTNSISEINTVQSYGGKFSEFLWYPFGTISASQVNTWLAAGHTMGVHFDDTAETDSSGVGGSAASWNGMQTVIGNALSSFGTTFPSAPFPITTRDHFLIWVSNDANGTADQVAQAKLFQNNGIQFDTSYSSFPNRWGYMTGSGLPMKFLDPVAGTLIPVYEQATQYEDDVQLGGNAYSVNWDLPTAQSHYQQSLSDSTAKYNTVVTMLFHPDAWSSYQSYAQTVLQYAQSNSIPMYTTGDWLNFWKSRAATTVSMPSFASSTLAFTETGSATGLALLVPEASGTNKVVSTFQVDGSPQSFTVATYQGVMNASVILPSGTHAISVTYTPAGRILGQISPVAAVASTTIRVQGGSITQTLSPAADGTYSAGPLPAGMYIATPTSSNYTFSPSSQSVTLGTTDATGVNFTAILSGETLFTTQTPVTNNASDGTGVNYELGTAFNTDTIGQITAVRFWKASSESGTHTGRIWSSTGTLLASVNFANETASGWQQQALTTPLSIAANTTYVVSVNTGNSFYVDTTGGLSSQVVNGDLRSMVGNNGLYGPTGVFPTNSYQGSNYFRDIVFAPGQTYGISGTIGPLANGPGTTVTLTGAASAKATADSSGNYAFSGLVNGSYTVTPTKTGFTFSPASSLVTVSSANITALNFTATAVPTYSISGTISPLANGPGTTVTLSGAASATATADSSGNYAFSGLVNGSYTVTPTKTGFTFSPVSSPVTVNSANITGLNFTATAVPTFSISGTISPLATGPGTTVTLSGAASATATADSSGNYAFSGLVNGSYTVTPTKAGYTFSPTSSPVTVNSANITGLNFTATANAATQTLFTTQTPTTVNASDGTGVNYELGTAFTSDIAGQITAVRFWKGSSESGTHTGRIWSGTGTLLASVTFVNETASGWQQQLLTSQISIAANTTYVVSVNTGNTFYVATNNGLSSQVNSGNLHSVVGNNGMFGTTGTFPTNTFQGSNYFRDIAFSATSVSGPPASIAATAGTPQSATISAAFTTALQATVKDSGNNPVTGVSVTFAAPGTGASGAFGGSATVTTNSSGVAIAPAFTANSTAGSYAVTASVAGVSTPASFSLTNTSVPTSVTASAGTPQSATIKTAFVTALQATVKDSGNNPVSGVSVTFAAPGTGASGTFGGSATVTTNSSGVATAPAFTANGTAGSYTVTASTAGVSSSASFSLTNATAPPASIAATAGSLQSATVGTAFATALQATVKDSGNNPVTGVSVTFAAPGTGASGTFGGSATVTTNSSGVATAPAFTANGTAGSYTVTATVAGVSTPASFNLTNTAGSAASVTATAGSPQSAAIGTTFATALQATVKDAGNNPVTGVSVTFAAPGTGASGTFGGSATVTTNSSGVATAPAFTANGTAGSYTVTASVAGVSTPASFSLTNTSVPTSVTATAGTPQSATIKTAFVTALQATVKDAGNNPVSGVSVTFAAPGTGASGTFGGSATVTTNSSGVAIAPAFTANSTAGSYTVTATVAGVSSPASFSLTNTAGSAASVTATAGSPQSAAIGTAFATALQATVKDSGNNPVTGVSVTFAAPGTGASGTFGGSATVTTNSSGVAIAPAFTANGTAGSYTVTATVAGVSSAASFSLTNTAGSAASIAATAGTPQSATIKTAFVTALQATVKDLGNNPVSGVSVTFAAPGTGASGTFGGSATVTTNGSGVATAPAFTANSTAGSYTVTATAVGVSTPASFALTNTAAAAIAVDVNKSTDRSGSAKTIASPSFATASANELLLAFISSDASSSGTNVSVSGVTGGALTWALVQRTNTQAGTSEIWRAFAPTALSGVTVTATLTQSVAASITVMSFTGVNTTGTSGSGAIGAVGSANALSGAPTASLITTKANSVVVGVGNDWDNAISRTIGPNQTLVHQYLATIGDTYWVQKVTTLLPAGSAVTVNDTAPTTDRYNLSICEIVP